MVLLRPSLHAPRMNVHTTWVDACCWSENPSELNWEANRERRAAHELMALRLMIPHTERWKVLAV
jgi:hypothetical protein